MSKGSKKQIFDDYLFIAEEMLPLRFREHSALIFTPLPEEEGIQLGVAKRRGANIILNFKHYLPGRQGAGVWITLKDDYANSYKAITLKAKWMGDYVLMKREELEAELEERYDVKPNLAVYDKLFRQYLVFEVEDIEAVNPKVPLEELKKILLPMQNMLARLYTIRGKERVFLKVFNSKGRLVRGIHIRYIPPQAASKIVQRFPQLAVYI